jgi:hypothetical protein
VITVGWVDVAGGRLVAIDVAGGPYITLQWEQARQLGPALAQFVREQGRRGASA